MSDESNALPQIPLGPYHLSRLIVGGNTINAGSHLGRFVDERLRRYYTPERVLEHLSACERAGINTWQSVPWNLDLYRRHRQEGGRLQYMSLVWDDPQYPVPQTITQLAQAGAIAIAHHGGVTDSLFKRGEIDSLRDFLRRGHDAGLLAGISTHMPAVVEYIEDKGWEVDFYMTCMYEVTRTREELKALLGHVPTPANEVYLEDDPPRMWQAIRHASKPCLAFKILAAGRLAEAEETVEQAFEATYRAIKPGDAIIVGMYPEYEDQVTPNTGYVRRFSPLSQQERKS